VIIIITIRVDIDHNNPRSDQHSTVFITTNTVNSQGHSNTFQYFTNYVMYSVIIHENLSAASIIWKDINTNIDIQFTMFHRV
jgi:hypothetical protein